MLTVLKMFDCRSGKDTGPWKWWNLIKCILNAMFEFLSTQRKKSILYMYVRFVGTLASILQWAFSVYLCFIEAMSEYKGVEVADVKTDLNRICCPRPSAPAVTSRKRSADAQHARRINRDNSDNSFHAYVGIEPGLPSLCQCMLACWWYLYIFVWITFNDCSVSFSEQVVWFSPNFFLRHLVFICSAFLFGRCRLNDPWFFTIE